MSSLISGVLSSTVGLLWNKVRDNTTQRLQHGDVTDAKIREVVVGELTDIKSKLDAQSRKELLTSHSFLEEGIHIIYECLEKSLGLKNGQINEQGKITEANHNSTELITSNKSEILNEPSKLTDVFGRLKIGSSKNIETAIEGFKEARKEATRAFWNESLKVEDRIFAAKLRIISKILECLEHPETAITSCFLFLKELHNLPDICEMFNVYIGGGPWSRFNKSERQENVKSVMLINYVLYQFVSEHTSQYQVALNWPTIQLAKKRFNPVWNWEDIATIRPLWGDKLLIGPNEFRFEEVCLPEEEVPINSRGEIVWCCDKEINVVTRYSEDAAVKIYRLPDLDEESQIFQDFPKAYALDEEDNLYVLCQQSVRSLETKEPEHRMILRVFNKYFVLKAKSSLPFLRVENGIILLLSACAVQRRIS